jgi:hypothetical protein
MKKLFFISLILFFTVSITAVYSQNYINEFDGIPIISSLPHDVGEYHYDSAKAMGTNILIMSNANSERLGWAKDRGFKVIPAQQIDSVLDNPYTYILRYTEGRYTKWEAEGNSPLDGQAMLSYGSIGKYFNESGVSGIVTELDADADTLIRGPGYRQEIYYSSKEAGDPIIYNADFRLKITGTGSPTDTICILQVVDSKIQGPPAVPYYIGEINFLRDIVLLRSDFTTGVWKTFTIQYELTEVDTEDIDAMPNRFSIADVPGIRGRPFADFIEFKVIWKGASDTRLFVDNVTIYDNRGRAIVTTDNAKLNVRDQANYSFNLANWDSSVTAWMALDEPESIDNYEPIRIVDSILNAESQGRRRLFVIFPSAWNGKYGDSPLGAEPLFKYEEFYRRVKSIYMSNDHHLYGPYTEDDHPPGDYRVHNINILADSVLDKLNDIDSIFSMTLICGKYDTANIHRTPTTTEMLYEANIKLMYGAKALTLYRYFGADNDTNFTGLVNYTTGQGYSYTERYWFIRNTLAPRLRGLFGKTLRNINQTHQHLNITTSSFTGEEYISNISTSRTESMQPDFIETYIDLGFFEKDDKDYFMLLHSYYNNYQELKLQ